MNSLLSLITPTNLNSEKERFFASSTYHPVFQYIWQDKNIEAKFSNKLKSTLWEAVKTQNSQAITKSAQDLFEVNINEVTLSQSKHDAALKGKKSGGSAPEFAKLMQQALIDFAIDYKIEISAESGFNARPQHELRKLIISRDAHFDYFSMEGGVHHDTTHIIRYLNGQYNKIRRSQNYLQT